jgi:threonine dehydrogenase-like Zn-dependent dehydrogenase
MNTLVCLEPGQLAYESRPTPQAQAGEALLRIRRIGICGTDLHAYEGTQPFFAYPRVLGHELAGELVSAVPGFEEGEAVTFIPYFNCDTCIACRSGLPNCCVHMQVCGVHRDGGMTEYLPVPTYALVHGQGLSFDELALVEPLAIGAHGVRRAAVRPDEFVLVVGAGPIGLGIMDINEQRLAFCQEKLHVPHVLNALAPDVLEQLRAITGGDMPTVVIDATGSLKAINNAFQYLAHGGRFVLVGVQKGDISFSHPEFHKREATLMSSRNATREDFEHVIASMKAGLVDPTTYITHRVDFGQVQTDFASWLDPATGVIKAMVALA